MDELRDYRYFAEDMIHPSEIAIKYIWERFCESMITKESRQIMPEIEKITKSLNHRPLHPDSNEYNIFREKLEQRIKEIRIKYPDIFPE